MSEVDEFEALFNRHGFEMPPWSSVGPGWFPILEDLLPKLKICGIVRIAQTKEKLGGLRVYIEQPEGCEAAQAQQYIREAEHKAWKTCEECGAPGELGRGSWYMVRCADCRGKYKSKS